MSETETETEIESEPGTHVDPIDAIVPAAEADVVAAEIDVPVEPELESRLPGMLAARLAEPGQLRSAVEAVLFVSDTPVSIATLAASLEQTTDAVQTAVDELRDGFDERDAGIELREIAGGVRLFTRPEHAEIVEHFLRDGQRSRLSQAALETLAVIAYRQPVTRARVSAIRGVNVDGVVRTLLARGLVVEVGNDPETGGGLFRTTELFLEKMGFGRDHRVAFARPAAAGPRRAGLYRRHRRHRRHGRHRRSRRSRRRDHRRQPVTVDPAPEGIRLQKVLASAGLGSRRKAEELIADGRVTINGTVAELGARVDPQTAVIHVDGDRVVVNDDLVHLVLNKPRGVVSTMSDERGRPCLGDLLAEHPEIPPEGLFHVGRLDAETEGLLLLTNDGDLAHHLMHPSFGVHKTYLATVSAPLARTVSRDLLAGIVLDDGPAKADSFRIVQSQGGKAIVEIVLHEGRKHIVRRMLAHVGHPVERLVRTAIGPVRLGTQKPGTLRPLTREELAGLHRLAEAG